MPTEGVVPLPANGARQPAAERARILVLVKGLGIGGAERLIASGAEHWDRESFDYHVAYVLPWKDALVPAIEKLGIPVTCIGGERGFDPATVFRFRRLVSEFQPALIHAHLPATGILARLTGGGVPVVYTEHNIAHSYRQPTKTLNRATYRRNTAVIAVSNAVGESLEGFPGPKPMVIENGVSVAMDEERARAARAELGLSDEPLVVHVGNIRPHKGHQNLTEAAVRLFAGHPTVHIVSIGGEKFPGDLERVRNEAARLGVADRLRFLGSRPDALDFVAAADMFVNPADVEGLPVAILEALAMGKPVVATAVGGVPSVVIDGETGRLVPPKDPAALADAILDVLGDPERLISLGKRGRELVEERYGLARMIERYEAVYRDVIGGVRR